MTVLNIHVQKLLIFRAIVVALRERCSLTGIPPGPSLSSRPAP